MESVGAEKEGRAAGDRRIPDHLGESHQPEHEPEGRHQLDDQAGADKHPHQDTIQEDSEEGSEHQHDEDQGYNVGQSEVDGEFPEHEREEHPDRPLGEVEDAC
jgi:hypothetical protein